MFVPGTSMVIVGMGNNAENLMWLSCVWILLVNIWIVSWDIQQHANTTANITGEENEIQNLKRENKNLLEKLNAIDRDLKVLNDKENESKMLRKFSFLRRNVIQRCLNMIKRWIFSLQNYVWCQVMKKGLLR